MAWNTPVQDLKPLCTVQETTSEVMVESTIWVSGAIQHHSSPGCIASLCIARVAVIRLVWPFVCNPCYVHSQFHDGAPPSCQH